MAKQPGSNLSYAHPGPPPHLANVQIRVQKALDAANSLHRWHYRSKIAVPYLVHPLDVLKILTYEWMIDEKGHEELWLAAILHDTLEDTYVGDNRTSKEDLQKLVGTGDYLSIVEELTFLSGDKKTYMETFRKEKSLAAFVVKMADRVANVRDFLVTDPDYAVKYFLKANPLWEGFEIRKTEIVAAFGDKICERMDDTIVDLAWSVWPGAIYTEDDESRSDWFRHMSRPDV